MIADIYLIAPEIYLTKNTISTNTIKSVDVRMVKFFARFLEEQTIEGTQTPSWL
uniref:Uncharacterized protein n=1 Tax=uncultured Nostoc sp. TaxID=340711 RepID=A0A8F8AK71_9NOSO|nr:hypothetical protein [uncultured Nostoc sp.]